MGYRILESEGDEVALLRARRVDGARGFVVEAVTSIEPARPEWFRIRYLVRDAIASVVDPVHVPSLPAESRRASIAALTGYTAIYPVTSLAQLINEGVHFGHDTKRWNPKMKRFILTERNGIYIIDVQQTLSYIDRAYEFVRETVAHGGTILFVGTKKQAQDAIEREAHRVGMPFVNERWLGGLLTNFSTVYKRLQRLKELEKIEQSGDAAAMTKRESIILSRERAKLERTLGGIRDMQRTPSALWVVDTKKEQLAVGEARKLGIPVIALLNSNADPDGIDYPIPGNDDAIRSVTLLTRVVADAVAAGLSERAGVTSTLDREWSQHEPLYEWELELLQPARPPDIALSEAETPYEAPSDEPQ